MMTIMVVGDTHLPPSHHSAISMYNMRGDNTSSIYSYGWQISIDVDFFAFMKEVCYMDDMLLNNLYVNVYTKLHIIIRDIYEPYIYKFRRRWMDGWMMDDDVFFMQLTKIEL